jgi:hypothetical protein
MLGSRSCTQAQPHAGPHKFDGASSSCAFLGIGVHRYRLSNQASIDDMVRVLI